MKNIFEFPDRKLIVDEASDWVIRMARDEPPSAEEVAAMNTWLAQSSIHKEVYLELASTWDGMDVLSGLVVPEDQGSQLKAGGPKLLVLFPFLLAQQVYSRFFNTLKSITPPRRWAYGTALMALIIAVVLIPVQTVQTYTTVVGEQASLTLEDGSTLWLNTNSQIEVDFSEGRRQLVLLKGEAHFDVKPDKSRPFEVYAGGRMVKAIGTAFSVYFIKDDIDVMVTEGKVELALVSYSDSSQQTPEIIRIGSLMAGQGVVIPPESDKLQKKIVSYDQKSLSRRIAWKDGRLVFEGETLDRVIAEVSRYTDVNIELVGDEVKKISVGGNFPAGELEQFFDALEFAFNIRVVRLSENYIQLHAK